MGLITDLLGANVTCIGLGNAYTRPLGYIIIQVQVDGVQGYDEDQIALVILDLSNFPARIPVILGTPTISHIINIMKEKQIDAFVMPWENARVAHLLSVHRMAAINLGDEIMEEPSSDDYDEVVYHPECRDYRSLLLLHSAGESGEGPCWRAYQCHDPGITDQRWLFATGPYYTKYVHRVEAGSKNAVLVVRNSVAYSQTLQKKTPVTRGVAATPVPGPLMEAQLQEGGMNPRILTPPN